MKKEHPEECGQPRIQLQVQTARGLWNMDEPEGVDKRPDYPISEKVQQVIDDARCVFGFAEEDSKYTLVFGQNELEPQRTLASYRLESGDLLVLSVQGGNA